MRKVFSSHNEVCHVWANQSQVEGRCSGNIFFQGKDIYSYGHHYLAARIHEVKGKKFALVRSDSYGPATSKHLCRIRGAVQGLMPYFGVTDVTDIKNAVKELDAEAQGTIAAQLKRVKITDKSDIKYSFERILHAFQKANELRLLLGRVEVWPTEKQNKEVQSHLDARLKRYRELNTPEMLAEREKVKIQQGIKDRELQREKLAQAIEDFRTFKGSQYLPLKNELLRVKDNEVETSRGAKVPFDVAVKMYRAIKNGVNVIGATIGNFTINDVYPNETLSFGQSDSERDTVVQIGCHRILLSEAARVLELAVA